MASLLVCSNLGHELPEIVEAIKKQADKMCFMAPAYASEPKSVLAKMLVELAGADTYKRVFLQTVEPNPMKMQLKWHVW